jgi:hypothetical protein
VDYLVVETVAANLALISGGYERHFEFAATLAEMKAFAPEMKVLFLHGVKDVVESYDLLRHAPSRLEREVFTLANQYLVGGDGRPERCATGFMVCLGDGLAPTEWAYLRRQWDVGYSFEPVRAGRLTWLWDERTVDALMEDYPRHGTWPGFRQVAHLVEACGLPVHTLCRSEDLARAQGPLLVPNADLAAPAVREGLRRYAAGPVVLLGNVAACDLGGAPAVSCRVGPDYVLGCVLLPAQPGAPTVEVPPAPGPGFRDNKPPCFFVDRPDAMAIPDEFWRQTAAAIRRCLEAWEQAHGVRDCHAVNLQDGLRTMTLEDAAGTLRTALVSCAPTYVVPQYTFTKQPTAVRKVSGFPYTPLVVVGDSIRSGHNQSPLHIPPYGIVVMDVSFGREA